MPDYDQVRRLGEGAFGEVWLVDDRALGVQRAVKYVDPSKLRDPTNFYEEPQTLRELTHPNIVTVEDAGTTGSGRLYIAMEYFPRGSVEDWAMGSVVPLSQALRLVEDVCRGAEYAHSCNFVHRDIKPANILIADDGTAKLSDFGLAARTRADGHASPYGYVAHLAPEVLQSGETSTASDIYAIGVTLYRMVNGDALLPTFAGAAELEDAISAGTFPDRGKYRPFIPRPVRTTINRAMSVDPADRFASASALRRALERIMIVCDWETSTVTNGTVWGTCVEPRGWSSRHSSSAAPGADSISNCARGAEGGGNA